MFGLVSKIYILETVDLINNYNNMKNIYTLVKFQLNSTDLMEDWKKMSEKINKAMQKAPGLLFRDSAVDSK
jgi:L-asparaginase/Glu-tRNA(Gln) amidotransferase subunit D